MAQIIDAPDNIGQGIGQGLSSGIQALASQKLERMANKQKYEEKVRGLKALRIPDAEQLAHLDDNSLQLLLKEKIEEPRNRSFANAVSGQGNAPQINEQQNSPAQGINTNDDLEYNEGIIDQLEAALSDPEMQKDFTPEQLQNIGRNLQAKKQQMQSNTPNPSQQPQNQQQEPEAVLNPKQALDVAKLNIEREKIQRKEKLEDRKLTAKEKSEIYKETKDFRKQLFEDKKQAKETLDILDRAEELEHEGLPTNGDYEALKAIGLDIPALLGANAEEFTKITANFIRGARSVYGGRVTNQELEQFLKTVPSLSNTPEGRKRIAANMRRIANLQVAAVEAYEEILKENDGNIPRDIDLLLDKRLDKKREAISKKFKEDLSKPVPASENPLLTVAKIGVGKAISNLPKAATGAGLGALAGSKFGGPIGAVGGGILGGLAGLGGYSVRDLI